MQRRTGAAWCGPPSSECAAPVLGGAGVGGEGVAEVVVAVGNPAWGRVEELQQWSELEGGVAAEGVCRTGDRVAALLPDAAAGEGSRGEDRVEVRAGRRVDAVGAGGAVADAAGVGCFDPRQVRFEGHAAVVRASVEERAREDDRIRHGKCAVRAGPTTRLIRHAVEVAVAADAAGYLDEQ